MQKNKTTKKYPYDPTWIRFRPCVLITMLVLGVIVIFVVVYLLFGFTIQKNRLDYHRICIDANEHRVLPKRNISSMIEPPPFAFGEISIDFGQKEFRWELVDVITPSVPNLMDLNLRGPLDRHNAFVAEVQLAMGIQKDKHDYAFQGREKISGKLAEAILDRPWAYYISFEDDTGKEVARDEITNTCYSNL